LFRKPLQRPACLTRHAASRGRGKAPRRFGAFIALNISIAFAQPSAVPDFDAASVKPDMAGANEGPGRGSEAVELTPSGLTVRNIRLRSARKWAYHVQTHQVSGPGWLDSERYVILAKTASSIPEDQVRLMLHGF
jgi:hypothetical protein